MFPQGARARTFEKLHALSGAFIVPNPFDRGSARLLQNLGFEALATTSAGCAFAKGLPDYALSREDAIKHVADIVSATALPVTADLENGFGDSPDEVARTIALAAQAGAVGGSIEDATGSGDCPLYPVGLAVERIRAAVESARAQPFPFMLTARAESLLVGDGNLADAIARIQAYQEAGANVLYVPGLKRRGDIAAVLASIDRPLNVVMGLGGAALDHSELARLGVKRISTGSSLARAAYAALLRAGREMLNEGSFTFADDGIPYKTLNETLARTCTRAVD